jgi:hypothetical protein
MPGASATLPRVRAPRTRRAAQRSEVAIDARTLDRIRHALLRVEAEAALRRGEGVTLLSGGADPGAPVETVVLSSGRAAQTAGAHVSRGLWSGGRLHTDAGIHALDPDGACFCRDCEMAGGHCVDDDE